MVGRYPTNDVKERLPDFRGEPNYDVDPRDSRFPSRPRPRAAEPDYDGPDWRKDPYWRHDWERPKERPVGPDTVVPKPVVRPDKANLTAARGLAKLLARGNPIGKALDSVDLAFFISYGQWPADYLARDNFEEMVPVETSPAWMAYWTHICTIAADCVGVSRTPVDNYRSFVATLPTGCYNWCNLIAGSTPLATPVPAAHNVCVVGHRQYAGAWRFSSKSTYNRIQAGDAPAPDPAASPETTYGPLFEVPLPDEYPSIAGASVVVVPRPRDGTPLTEPSGQPERKEHPDAPTRTVPVPVFPVPGFFWPWPVRVTDPTPDPLVQVVTITESDSDTDVDVDTETDTDERFDNRPPGQVELTVLPRPPANPNRRPLPGVHERKVRLSAVGRLAWFIIGEIHDGIDFMDVFFKALPKDVQRLAGFRSTPVERANVLWEHLDEVDVAQALENYLNEQIEDWFYGKFDAGKVSNQLTNKPTEGGYWFDHGPGREEFDDLIPEFHFDPDTGQWWLDTPFGTIQGEGAFQF